MHLWVIGYERQNKGYNTHFDGFSEDFSCLSVNASVESTTGDSSSVSLTKKNGPTIFFSRLLNQEEASKY